MRIESIILPVLFFLYVLGPLAIRFLGFESSINFSWVSLLMTSFLILLANKSVNLLRPFFLVFVFGFIIEVVGVKTGWPFGYYNYGDTLGFKMFEVPLVMGLNWFLVLFGSNAIARKVTSSLILRLLLTALLATAMDFLIEPVAIDYNMWSWETEVIPLKNYMAWFFTAFTFSIVFELLAKKEERRYGVALYIFMLVFFIIL
ncbi:MAG: carotenoid biosynthesis protein [Flavobacteriales bacterium]|nr:carotenoid biosynthesis protein [Flavobacteriales bacterium]